MIAKVLYGWEVNEGISYGFIASDLQFSVHADVHFYYWIQTFL